MTVPSVVLHLFDWVLWNSAGAAILTLLVLVTQWIVGSRISARWRYSLWVLVVFRLLMPALPAVRIPPRLWVATQSLWNHPLSGRVSIPPSRQRPRLWHPFTSAP